MIRISDLTFEVKSAELVGTLCPKGDLFWALRVTGKPSTPKGLENEWRPYFTIEELPAPKGVNSWQEILPCRVSWSRSEDFEDASFSLESSYPIFDSDCTLELEGKQIRIHWSGTTEVNRDQYQSDIPFTIDALGVHCRIESLVSDEKQARGLLRKYIADSSYSFTSAHNRYWFVLKF